MAKNSSSNSLGIVIVAYDNQKHINALVEALSEQIKPGDQIILVDNKYPDYSCAHALENNKSIAKILKLNNVGFGAGCNAGAAAVKDDVDLLVFLNPDTKPLPGFIDALRNGKSEWSGWMGLLTLPNGNVNSAGNVVHISGLSWVLGYDKPAELYKQSAEVSVLSGADMAISAAAWREVGGFEPYYFLYYEDTDISFRLLLKGHKIGLQPAAKIMHDYDFGKGSHKWFYIERNRYVFILRCWPISVIIVLLPMLLVCEVGLWLISIVERRFTLKIKSTLSFIKMLPRVLKSRRHIQKGKILSAHEFINFLEPKINTPLLGVLEKSKFLNLILVGYFSVAKIILILPQRLSSNRKRT